MEIGIATGQAMPALEVRGRDHFPAEVPVVTLNGVPCDHRRERQPYETVAVEMNDVEDVTLSVAWDGVQKRKEAQKCYWERTSGKRFGTGC